MEKQEYKNFIYSDAEEEQLFLDSSPELALKYAINIKKTSLCNKVENYVFEYFCNSIMGFKEEEKINKLKILFDYLKITKFIPEKYFIKLINNLNPKYHFKFSECTRERLPKKFEDKMFDYLISRNMIWPLVEYQFAIGTVLPEKVHNYILLNSLEQTSNSDAAKAYLLNTKNC